MEGPTLKAIKEVKKKKKTKSLSSSQKYSTRQSAGTIFIHCSVTNSWGINQSELADREIFALHIITWEMTGMPFPFLIPQCSVPHFLFKEKKYANKWENIWAGRELRCHQSDQSIYKWGQVVPKKGSKEHQVFSLEAGLQISTLG